MLAVCSRHGCLYRSFLEGRALFRPKWGRHSGRPSIQVGKGAEAFAASKSLAIISVLDAATAVGSDLFTGRLGEYHKSPRGDFSEKSGCCPDLQVGRAK
jgi:hypothetical protein